MTQLSPPSLAQSRPRGRPPRTGKADTRAALIRTGMEMLTERGFNAVGLDEVLRQVGVPKGSFYHFFASKEAFGLAVIDAYDAYLSAKLARHFHDGSRPPLRRLGAFVADARAGMARHGYRRGCLVGNLGQELGALNDAFRDRLEAALDGWQRQVRDLLAEAQAQGELDEQADIQALADLFWIGWEGAILRAKLTRSDAPLELFARAFLAGLPRRDPLSL